MASEDSTKFTEKLSKAYEQSFIAMGVEIGLRLGIFDHMIKVGKPLTSQEIADGLALKERYIREWLGIVTCGGVVDISKGKFSIPEHRVPVLSSTSSSNCVDFSLMIGMCARVSDDITQCFKLDGPKGLPYSKYPLLHHWRESTMKHTFSEDFMISNVKMVPGLLEKLEEGIEMCDLGCSSGVVPLKFAQRFPNTKVYGYDISEDAIREARRRAKHLGLQNALFEVQDCCNMPEEWSKRFDLVYVFDVVHDLPKADVFLSDTQRILKPGCPALIADINMKTDMEKNVAAGYGAMGYGCSLFHCMAVSLYEDGLGLGTAWGIEKGEEMMKAAGFSKVEVVPSGQAYYICYK